jgi:hypothetical protein
MFTQSVLPSSFIIIQKQRHILYPNYTLSFIKLRCECAIVVLLPKYSFLIVYSIPIRKSHSEPSFSLLFVFFHSETGDSSFFIQRKKIHILYPYYTLPVFQDNFILRRISIFFTIFHTFLFISLISECVL